MSDSSDATHDILVMLINLEELKDKALQDMDHLIATQPEDTAAAVARAKALLEFYSSNLVKQVIHSIDHHEMVTQTLDRILKTT